MTYTLKTTSGRYEFELDTDTMPEATLEYLLRYGYNKTMADCHAGAAAEIKTKADAVLDLKADAKTKLAWQSLVEACGHSVATIDAGSNADRETLLKALRIVRMSARQAQLEAGTIRHGEGGGARLNPVEVEAWNAAERATKVAFDKENDKRKREGRIPNPMPKGKAWSTLVDKNLDKYRDHFMDLGRKAVAASAAAAGDMEMDVT